MSNVTIDSLVSFALRGAAKLLLAVIILFISFKTVNFIARKIEKAAQNKNADKTVIRTLAYAFKIASKGIVVICLIGFLGIDTSGITALIASLGVGIGLAVNGALSNLAGGVILILIGLKILLEHLGILNF